jgi:hypothetical protein
MSRHYHASSKSIYNERILVAEGAVLEDLRSMAEGAPINHTASSPIWVVVLALLYLWLAFHGGLLDGA